LAEEVVETTSSQVGIRQAGEIQQQITAVRRVVTETPASSLVEEEVPVQNI
jgi:hypothetical protein